MIIKVPFLKRTPFGSVLKNKELDFVFNIATLEDACNRMDIDFWQMSEVDGSDFALSVLYAAYIQGCKAKYKKPKYTFTHAVIWNQYMDKESAEKVKEAMGDLFGKLKSGSDEVKKK